MSARTRELFSLVLVGVLVGTAFASVYIARQEVVSTESLSYALFFLGLYVAAHVVTRITVPHADPYLLPMAGLLTGIGLTEIYRLDEDEAFRQGLWIVIGLVVFAATLLALRRDYRRLESYKYLFGLGALVLLALPAMPFIGTTVNGARLWVELGPVRFQPGEFAKICLIVFLAGYLREKREVLAQARLKDLGPLLFIWGGAMAVLVLTNDLGGGLLYFGIFLAMLYVATAQTWFVVGRRGDVRRRRRARLHPGRAGLRSGCGCGSTRGATPTAAATRRSSRSTRSRTATSAGPASARAPSRTPTGTS